MKNIIAIIALCSGLISCTSFHYGTISGGAYPPTPDYTLSGSALSTASTFHVLGFGGYAREALIYDAKQKLYENYPLKKGQAFVNFTVDYEKTYYPFCSKLQVVLAADIVEKNPFQDSISNSISEVYFFDRFKEVPLAVRKELNLETIDFYLAYEGKIYDRKDDKISISYINEKGHLDLKQLEANGKGHLVFPQQSVESKLPVGSTVKLPTLDTSKDGSKYAAAKVLVATENYYLLQLAQKRLIVFKKTYIDKLSE